MSSFLHVGGGVATHCREAISNPSFTVGPVTVDERVGAPRSDFLREIVEDDLRTGKHGGRVVTRFPPEPNGYLHIGHAKSICLNFGIALQYGSHCNLRFDDTNPLAESVEYVESIERDVRWLGFSYGDRALYASDYFDEMYQLAEDLIRQGKAYEIGRAHV
jgi:glutaminyl-tRNA synthetase